MTEILDFPRRWSGVYYLVHRGEVVYVGKSLDVWRRVVHHKTMSRYPDFAERYRTVQSMQFDSVKIEPCDPAEMDSLETQRIREHQPLYNRYGLSDELCKVVLCGGAATSKGYCDIHYSRAHRHGHPLWGRRQCAWCGRTYRYLLGAKPKERCPECLYRECLSCSQPFQVKATGRDQKYCSPGCIHRRSRPWHATKPYPVPA